MSLIPLFSFLWSLQCIMWRLAHIIRYTVCVSLGIDRRGPDGCGRYRLDKGGHKGGQVSALTTNEGPQGLRGPPRLLSLVRVHSLVDSPSDAAPVF